MCQKFESTYFLLKFPFHMKSYVTDSIFSPIRGCFDVAKVYFFSAILKKKILLQKSTAPKITSTISKKLIEKVFRLIKFHRLIENWDKRWKIHFSFFLLTRPFSKYKNGFGHIKTSSDWAKNWISCITFHKEWEFQ